MSLNIRKACETDIPAIAMLEKLCFHTPWPEEFIHNDLVLSQNDYLILEKDSRPAGYAGMWIISGEANLNNICIHPDFRGNGYGRELLCALMQVALDRGVNAMTLEVRVGNSPAIALYEKMGFRIEGIRKKYYQDNGEDACIMWNRDLRACLDPIHHSCP